MTAIQCYCGLYITSEFLLRPVWCIQRGIRAENQQKINTKHSLVLVNRLRQRIQQLQVGDSIVIRSVTDPNKFEDSKIYGLEGDFIRVNDPNLPETEVKFVPPGHVWLQSDEGTYDSRSYGPVPRGLIIGHKFYKINVN
ncbi:uncharacterized protein TRIADDRAFT_52123 [Trichoplax adhaerens]|uniref:Mitochondrial inner membrane protease subunit 1 n=1 Tax=Trichoplax adhaerens TaxID=10228 RepID=B3RLU1_TRIAD|nr:hypothetical protein TRIADDRAFT_52123 [Trichoplax adhaerens]EDV29583.1 hypothetical protein TRIADDRAFT_52123 [Trichoplax adhaerens]|eukprot:XP_002108785.1 hypothetical protein TRIADDRAFT_52123 [Trichoplax adhaerens]